MRRACCLVATMLFVGCGAREEPVAATRLAVRALVTGYEGNRTALESAAAPGPRAAGDSATWAAMWTDTNLQPPAPSIAFDREIGVLYGYPRSSCTLHRSAVDSARLETSDGVRIFVSDRSENMCSDTTSFSVVAAAVQRSPRWSTPPRIVGQLNGNP